jgi:hypothetical protein
VSFELLNESRVVIGDIASFNTSCILGDGDGINKILVGGFVSLQCLALMLERLNHRSIGQWRLKFMHCIMESCMIIYQLMRA